MPLRYLTAGESHGPMLTAILEGMVAGLELFEENINFELMRRQKGYGSGPRMKIENDAAQITGGVMKGKTTGAPISVLIHNKDHENWKGKEVDAFTSPRPGHADLAGAVKYDYNDLRPTLERASARETAARVAVGAICKHFLALFNIDVFGYVVSIGDVDADLKDIPLDKRFDLSEEVGVRCPDHTAAEKMREKIRAVIEAKDTLGGVIEVAATGVPIGLGSHVQADRKLDGRLAKAVMSVQAMKGVEFGEGFNSTRQTGTQVHDAIQLEGNNLVRPTNRSGGIEGGMSNGMPIILRAAMKPIATTLTPQQTVNLETGEEVPTTYERSDFCPVPRAVPILEGVVAFILADALLEKLGGDSIEEITPRFEQLRKATLDELIMQGGSHKWWDI